MSAIDIITLAAGGSSEAGHGFNWLFVGEHFVNLVLLLAILIYFLKHPIKQFLIERRRTIGNKIDEAREKIEEARNKFEEYNKKLENIENEISSLKDYIKQQGENERAEIIKRAQETSEILKREARETIELETRKAQNKIQAEAVSKSLEIAKNIIRQSLERSGDINQIDEFIKIVEEEKWQQSQH